MPSASGGAPDFCLPHATSIFLGSFCVFEINDRHILVTGGSSGFGRHFARFLAGKGASVTLAARRAEALAAGVAEINGSGGKAQSVVLDVTIADKIDDALKEAEAKFGPIHAVVNNAGVTATRPALDQDERAWDSVIDTNLKGVWLVAQAAARRMIENKVTGSIVNIASILGVRVAGAVAPYAISKAGVIQMTKALALEWARHGIRVNSLAPGYFATELNDDFFESENGKALIRRVPQRRLGQLDELDGPLLLLISDAGSFMTGSIVVVDGGHLVSGL
jgi:NAD(P)-dependent dehydrogenase (short-subunit alcohol dehydrogenase family)